MNLHWGLNLGDVAEFIRGVTYKPGDVSTADDLDAIPCMRTKNIQEQLETDDLVYIPKRPISAQKRLRRGDILVSSANSWNLVGKCSWVPELPYEATFGGFTSVLRANPDRVDPRYLYRWFSSTEVQTVVRSFGQQTTNISNLNQNLCLAMRLSLPPLDEQHRIAAILDKADALRQKRKSAIALLDSLTQSIFLEMFGDPESNPLGWPTVSLGDLIKDGPTNGLYRPASEYGSGTPIVRIDAFYDGVITGLSSLKRLRIDDKTQSTFALQQGEIVINRVNSLEYLGKSALVPALSEPTVFESNMMRIRIDNSRITSGFCVALLQMDWIKKQIARAAKKAVNQASINQNDVKSFSMLLPPLTKQVQFDAAIAQIGRMKDRIAINQLDHLFASLQHRAFSGQL